MVLDYLKLGSISCSHRDLPIRIFIQPEIIMDTTYCIYPNTILSIYMAVKKNKKNDGLHTPITKSLITISGAVLV